MNNIIPLWDDLPPPSETAPMQTYHIHTEGIVCPVCGIVIVETNSLFDYKGRTAAAKAKLDRWNNSVTGKGQS